MSYQRESWMMEKDEKLQTVPILHMQGNLLVKQTKYREAASKYKEAVLLLKTVQSRVSEGLEEQRCGAGSSTRDFQACREGLLVFWGHAAHALFQREIPVFLLRCVPEYRQWGLRGWRRKEGGRAVEHCLT